MNRKCCLLQSSDIEARNMGDSNPNSGDWNNTTESFTVFAAAVIIVALLIVLVVTGHVAAALILGFIIALLWALKAASEAAQHEPDH
jgi:Flp pilus assembly protein TadB